MKRFHCAACAVTLASMFLATDVFAAKGIQRNGNNMIRGTVVAVNHHGQGGGVGGNFGQSGSVTVKRATFHRKMGAGGNFVNGGNGLNNMQGTQTFQVNSSTQIHRMQYGRRLRTHFGSVRQGEHVIVHGTNGQLARGITILSSSYNRTNNRHYGYGVHRHRSYGRSYAQYYHHHQHHHFQHANMPAGLQNGVMPVVAKPVVAKPAVTKPTVVNHKPNPALVSHVANHSPTNKTAAQKVASNKPMASKVHHSVSASKPAVHNFAATKTHAAQATHHHAAGAHHSSGAHHSGGAHHHAGGHKK